MEISHPTYYNNEISKVSDILYGETSAVRNTIEMTAQGAKAVAKL